MNDNQEATIGVVGFAQVMPGLRSFKDAGIANVTDTYHGQILTGNEELKIAVLKDLSPKELANEILAASLASVLKLPVPPAFIGITEPGDPAATRTKMMTGHGLMFASVNVHSPSIASLVIRKTERETLELLRPIVEILAKQPWIGELYGFDAWVANVDRHIGNVLFTAERGGWIIDHGRCFTGPEWIKADLVSDKKYTHRLSEWATPFLSSSQRKTFANEASNLSNRLRQVDVRQVGEKNSLINLIGEPDFDALILFLSERIAHVPRYASEALDESRIA